MTQPRAAGPTATEKPKPPPSAPLTGRVLVICRPSVVSTKKVGTRNQGLAGARPPQQWQR